MAAELLGNKDNLENITFRKNALTCYNVHNSDEFQGLGYRLTVIVIKQTQHKEYTEVGTASYV
jgi:hypothetical protein